MFKIDRSTGPNQSNSTDKTRKVLSHTPRTHHIRRQLLYLEHTDLRLHWRWQLRMCCAAPPPPPCLTATSAAAHHLYQQATQCKQAAAGAHAPASPDRCHYADMTWHDMHPPRLHPPLQHVMSALHQHHHHHHHQQDRLGRAVVVVVVGSSHQAAIITERSRVGDSHQACRAPTAP